MAKLFFKSDGGQEQQVQIQPGTPPLVLGRDRRCDICIPITSVSRNHAKFSFGAGRFAVEDMGSSNGTFVNGEPIQTPRFLSDEDEIRCGEVLLRFVMDDLAATPHAPTTGLPQGPPAFIQSQPEVPVQPQRAWVGTVTPYFPETWPLDDSGMFFSYQYAYSNALPPGGGDDIHIMAPTTRVRRHVGGWEETETINAEPDELGVQTIRSLTQEEIKCQNMADQAASMLFQSASSGGGPPETVETIRAFYKFWFTTNEVISAWIQDRHGAFYRWATTAQTQDRGGITQQVDNEVQKRLRGGFEFPVASGMFFSLSVQAQTNHLGMSVNMDLVAFPVTMFTRDDIGSVVFNSEAELRPFLAAAFLAKEAVLDQGRALKGRVIRAWDTARAQAEVNDWISGKSLPQLSNSLQPAPASAPSAPAQHASAPTYKPPPTAAPQYQPPPTPKPSPARLTLLFDNQQIVIEKDTYIVGRSPSKTDITIADSNISSRHAQVVRKNGQYFLEDLASTNGVHFKGELIKSRAIEEGDVFHLCEHELRFVFT